MPPDLVNGHTNLSSDTSAFKHVSSWKLTSLGGEDFCLTLFSDFLRYVAVLKQVVYVPLP